MKPTEHQETYKAMEEIQSNDRNTTTKEKKVCGSKASQGKCAERHETETASLQHSG